MGMAVDEAAAMKKLVVIIYLAQLACLVSFRDVFHFFSRVSSRSVDVRAKRVAGIYGPQSP